MSFLDTLAIPGENLTINFLMLEWLTTALGLILIIEGLIYSVFPKQMKAMLKSILDYSDSTLVWIGLPVALFGLFLIWIVRI